MNLSNTYTNKTWSEVSGVPLAYLNAAEKECLQGLEYDLYVNKEEYESWLKLLQGLVLSKDRARGLYHQRSRRPPRTAIASRPPPSQRADSSRFGYGHRARSSSPSRLRLPALHVPPTPMSIDPSSAWRPPNAIEPVGATSGLKRSAVDAFSPTSGSFDVPRLQKRPTGITLEIPYTRIGQPSPPESKGVSPLEPLSGFGRLSLANSDSPMQGRTTASSQTMRSLPRYASSSSAVARQLTFSLAPVLLRALWLAFRAAVGRRWPRAVAQGPASVSPTFDYGHRGHARATRAVSGLSPAGGPERAH
jgi:hypothetical protein